MLAAAWAAIASIFVLVGAGNLELGPIESRLGLAAGEGLGPYGQVLGGYDPTLWAGKVFPSQVWARGEGGTATAASVRWPAAIALLLAGFIINRRAGRTLEPLASTTTALACFGTLGAIHLAGPRFDWLGTLFAIAALDRILAQRSDAVAGLFAGLAFLASGWPPLVLIALPILILGRPGKTLSWSLALPVLAIVAAWSVLVLLNAPALAWAEALTLPLTMPPAWTLGPMVFVWGLPFAPLSAIVAYPSIRGSLTPRGRALVIGWLHVGFVTLLAGTLIPGLASVALGLALLANGFVAGAVMEVIWSGGGSSTARRTFLGVSAVLVLSFVLLVTPASAYFAAAVSYYRPLGVLLAILALATGACIAFATWNSRPRWALGTLLAVALCLKLAHWGIYVPESNYRLGKGPWGRAIGQWVLPGRPVYTFHSWPTDLLFAIGRPVRQLQDPLSLKHRVQAEPVWVLLLRSEFERWPEKAPRLVKIREFEDELGWQTRVLARTEGALPIRAGMVSHGHRD